MNINSIFIRNVRLNSLVVTTVSTTKYAKLFERLSRTRGCISNEKHSIVVEEINILENVFMRQEEVLRIIHTNCFECSRAGKQCGGEFLIDELLNQLS